MLFIREAILYVSKVSTDETKHFLICIMTFLLNPGQRRCDHRWRVHKMAVIAAISEIFVSEGA